MDMSRNPRYSYIAINSLLIVLIVFTIIITLSIFRDNSTDSTSKSEIKDVQKSRYAASNFIRLATVLFLVMVICGVLYKTMVSKKDK